MKFNKILAVALAATTLFASCSKENVENANGEDITVSIKIDRASDATRVEGANVGNAAVTFTSGSLIFTNPSDVVTMVVAVNTGSAPYASKTVGIEALANGQQITAVPSASTKVYFVGNAPSGVTFAEDDALSTKMATVFSQYKADGSVDNVTIFGGKALTPVSDGEADEFEAAFNATPIAARFEIKKIAGEAADGTSTLTYKVAGIFIDKYYDKMTLAGAAVSADLKSNGSVVANYASGAGSYLTTPTNMTGVVFDYNGTTGIATQTNTTPSTKAAWAYNLLAPTSTSPAMPAIIIKFIDVKVDDTEYGTQFLTINTFYTAKGGSTALTQLAQGHIYVLDNIEFDENDLTPTPYLKDIKATVTVTMVNWESSNIGWAF
jgi:hypothetical protein